MNTKLQIVATAIVSALLTWAIAGALEKRSMPMVRIAELRIDPASWRPIRRQSGGNGILGSSRTWCVGHLCSCREE